MSDRGRGNPGVVVRCGYCGQLGCFHPKTVRWLGECRCGNDNWGNPSKDWPQGKFGDFDFLWGYTLDFKLLGPNFWGLYP